MSDERLLVKRFLQNRDEETFLVLYRQFMPLLYPLAVHLLGGKAHDAEEVVQEMWIRAVRKLPEFRWESQLRTWFTAILLRCCMEKRRSSTQPPIHFEAEPEDHKTAIDPGIRMDLQVAIAALSEGQRAVFLLHDAEGYTHEEIGSLLGIEPGTSKSQLFYARKLLRSYLMGGNR